MQLVIESMTYGNDSIAHCEGKTVFVSGGVPGDVVEAQIVETGKSFDRAVVSKVLEPSPKRIRPRCPYADVCGGCPWSNMSYDAQVDAKRKNVCDTLTRIGKMDPDLVQSLVSPVESPSDPWGYRNKIELAAIATPRGISLGMHAKNDDAKVVPVDRCLLLDAEHQRLPKAIGGALRYFAGNRDLGIERCGIRVSKLTNQVEVALWTDPEAFPRNEAAKILRDAADPTSIVRVLVKKGDSAARKIAGLERLHGYGAWEEKVSGTKVRISAPSFFQVNTPGAQKLVDLVLKGLDPQEDEAAADLYCGAGTFTIPLARRADATVAIESYGPAVRDLRHNVERCSLDDRVEIVGDDTARQLDYLEDMDVVVVDPPRAGLDKSVVEAISQSPARAFAYVSCDPATLARDLALFASFGTFAPTSITPVDLFPQTYHVETVCLMIRK